MTSFTVTELPRRLEPVTPDSFIDDWNVTAVPPLERPAQGQATSDAKRRTEG